MKKYNSILGILAVSSFMGGVVTAQNQVGGSYSFTSGNYRFFARQQQTNGLMRSVTVNQGPGLQKLTSTITAKFARRDPIDNKRWILGNVVIRQYQSNGTLVSEAGANRMYINVGQQPVNK